MAAPHDVSVLLKENAELAVLLRAFVDGFKSDPGTSDLDNEQPIHPCVELGVWRKASYLLSRRGGSK